MRYFPFILLHVCDAITHERLKTNNNKSNTCAWKELTKKLYREPMRRIQLELRACKDKLAEIPQDFSDNLTYPKISVFREKLGYFGNTSKYSKTSSYPQKLFVEVILKKSVFIHISVNMKVLGKSTLFEIILNETVFCPYIRIQYINNSRKGMFFLGSRWFLAHISETITVSGEKNYIILRSLSKSFCCIFENIIISKKTRPFWKNSFLCISS